MSVERAGVERWLAARERSAELAAWRGRLEQQAQILKILSAGRARVASLYREAPPLPQRRQAKRELLGAIGAQLRAYERQQGLRSGYDAWLDAGLNNAHLASVATYFDCLPGLENLLAQ